MAHILVTGASGFVGQAVVRRLLGAGHSVRALCRRGSRWPFRTHGKLTQDFGDMTDRDSLDRVAQDIDGIVHLAAAKSDEPFSEAVNVQGAHNLVTVAPNASFLINISTQSARLPRKGAYGRTKEAADRIFHESGIPTTTLRASIIYGDRSSGVFGSIVRFSKLPAIPVFGDGKAIFRPIHRDDLAHAVELAVSNERTRGEIFDVGGPDELTLDALIDRISGGRPKLHLPRRLGLLIARVPGAPVTVSNVLGSTQTVEMEVERFFDLFNFTPRGFEEGLRTLHEAPPHGESALLLEYAVSALGIRWEAGPQEVERYEAARRANGIDPDHELDGFFHRWPSMLGSLEILARSDGTLRQKLLVAAAVMECHPATADALLPRDLPKLRIVAALARLSLRVAAKLCGALVLLPRRALVKKNAG